MITIVVRAWYEHEQLRARITFGERCGRSSRSIVTDSVEEVGRIVADLIACERP